MQISWVFNHTARVYRGYRKDVSESWKFVIHLHGGCHRTTLVKCFQVTTKRLALDEESNVDTPHDNCGRHNDLMAVPNGNADNHNE